MKGYLIERWNAFKSKLRACLRLFVHAPVRPFAWSAAVYPGSTRPHTVKETECLALQIPSELLGEGD